MLVLRFRETFRERSSEWAISAGMFGWGLLTLISGNLFVDQVFFHPLLTIMSQVKWGVFATLIGAIRILFLIINGAWRPSAHIRAIGSALGVVLWGTLFICALSLDWVTPTSALYTLLLGLDLLSLWFTAGDAKLADLSARGKTIRK